MSRPTRRTVLACVGAMAVAGCAADPDSDAGTDSPDDGTGERPATERDSDRTTTATDRQTPTATTVAVGTESLPTRLWVDRRSLSASERESVDPIVFEDLPAAEQEVVSTALDEGEYTVATDREPPAVDSLRDRIEARAGDGLAVYLRRASTYYRVGFAAGDHVIAHPDM